MYLVIDFLLNSNYPSLPDSGNSSGNYAELLVYYENFEYVLISQSPKVTNDVLYGTIGGLLGLFLGASFLEIIVFVFSVVQILVTKPAMKSEGRCEAVGCVEMRSSRLEEATSSTLVSEGARDLDVGREDIEDKSKSLDQELSAEVSSAEKGDCLYDGNSKESIQKVFL